MATVSTLHLDRYNIATWNDATIGTNYAGDWWLEPVFQMNDSDSLVTTDDWYGDRCIGSQGSVHILDQQWILSVSWGDGFAIRRINDNGTITRVYGVSNGNGYNHHTGLVYHPGTRQVFINQYNTPRMGVVDLGAWIDAGKPDNGAGITQTDNIYQLDATWNFPTDQTGTSYENGLGLAGDWLYMASYARNAVNGVYRWNVNTRQYETIPIQGLNWNSSYWEGTFVYDDRLDRLFYLVRWTGGLSIIENASSANPTARFVSFSGHGANHCTYKGVFYPEPGNTNRIIVGGEWRFFDLDITDVLAGTTNTPTYLNERYTYNNPWALRNYFPFASDDPYMEDEYRGGSPYGPYWIPIYSDRGWLRKSGWFDLENFAPVGRCGEDNYSHERDTVFSDYMGGTFKVTSANGTHYYIYAGYGWDGHRIRVYNKPFLLKPQYSITFGTLTNADGIAAVDLDALPWTWKVPSGTTLTVEVSNNNGSTYEAYSGGLHEFASTGTQLRVRYTASGLENKMPYAYRSNGVPMAIAYAPGYMNLPNLKALTTRIAGRNG